jgi:hypothetical protein
LRAHQAKLDGHDEQDSRRECFHKPAAPRTKFSCSHKGSKLARSRSLG